MVVLQKAKVCKFQFSIGINIMKLGMNETVAICMWMIKIHPWLLTKLRYMYFFCIITFLRRAINTALIFIILTKGGFFFTDVCLFYDWHLVIFICILENTLLLLLSLTRVTTFMKTVRKIGIFNKSSLAVLLM